MKDEEMAEEYVKKEGFRSGMFGELDNITSSEANKEIEQAFLAGLKVRNDQLSKAKEIIKQLMYASRDCIAWYCLCDKANQFLEEIKENE